MSRAKSRPPRAGSRDGRPLRRIGTLVAFAALLVACAAAPGTPGTGTPAATISDDPRNLIVIAHGTGGSAGSWPASLERAIRAEYGALEHWKIVVVDWKAVADRPLSAARRGYRIGLDYANSIAAAPHEERPRVVHLIAHSMGAHLIQGIADGLSRASPAPPAFIQMTFLDAFHPRGVAALRWGIRVFGRNADFAESYVTRDEPAFLTNALLRRAFTFDLTATVPPRENPSSGYAHNWPPAWYVRSVGEPTRPGFALSPLALLGDESSGPAALERLFGSLRTMLPPGVVREVLP